ncbi:MAG: cytochrome P450 [Sandaracinaceae bacterium]|nr:cytochrome P450 [Sandaracinaceae bacterium]
MNAEPRVQDPPAMSPPPSPRAPLVARGLPLLGSALPMLKDPLAFLRAEHARLGPVFRVRAPGRSFTVMAGREANDYLSREGRDVLVAAPFWHRLTVPEYGSRQAIVAQDGEPHARTRHTLRSGLSKALLEDHLTGAHAVMAHTCAAGDRADDGARDVSVSELTRLLVSRVVHHTVTAGSEEPVPDALATAMTERFRWEANARLLGKWPALALRLPAHRRRVRDVDAFADRLVRRARAGVTSPWGLLGLTLADAPEAPYSVGDLRLHFLFPFVGGVDTVAATLGFWLYEVLRDEALTATLRAEVDALYDGCAEGEHPSTATLRGCAPLLGSMMEALRLCPAAFGVYREAARDFTFAGHTVRRGEDVMVFTTASHFDPACFPEPERFDVTRVSQQPNPYRQKQVFMPYGVGAHICLGAALGEAVLLQIMAHLLRHHALQLTRVPATVHTFDPSLAPSSKLRMRLVAREGAAG